MQPEFFKPRGQMRDMFDGSRVLRLITGKHRVVAERHGKPDGALVARELFMDGDAEAECSGLMEITMYSGLVKAGEKVRVNCWGGKVEARIAEVMLWHGEAIGRDSSVVYVASDDAIVSAFDDAIVIVNPGWKPKVKLHDRAQIVRWRKPERLRRAA